MSVPVGYLATVALVAWCTGFALAAPSRPRVLAVVAFWSGLLLNEQPFLALVWLSAATALVFAQGDVASPAAWAAVALAAATSVGLVLLARRGLRARPVLDRALAEGFGAPVRTPAPRRRDLLRTLLVPLPVRPRGVERIADIPYGDAGRRHLLDVYRHRSRPGGRPALVYLHGGGYTGGGKDREARALLHRFAARGWVCVSVNDRLRPGAGLAEHLADARQVVAWVREHGAVHGADGDTVVVAGSSAGAHLAALLALAAEEPAHRAAAADTGPPVAAAVCLYGYFGAYYGMSGAETSPTARVHAGAPPFLVVHGDHDTLVPAADARRFVSALRQVSAAPVCHAELPGAQHSFDVLRSVRFDAVVDAVEVFAARVAETGGGGR